MGAIIMRYFCVLVFLLAVMPISTIAGEKDKLFVAKPFTEEKSFTEGIEGPNCDKDGKTHLVAEKMGTTNGIEVSPDGKTLYVNESVQRNVWAFPIDDEGGLGEKKLLKKFDDHGFDGMRCDVAGNIYITRYGKGTVVKLSPAGEVLKEIDVLGKQPSNICFGGPDGRTAYVTEVENRRVVQFRVDKPG